MSLDIECSRLVSHLGKRIESEIGVGFGRASSSEVAAMKLNAFSCGGGYILSPEHAFAPLNSENECGKVSTLIGPLECDHLPSDLCANVMRQIDERTFAFVSSEVAAVSNLRAMIDDLQRDEN